MAEWRAAMVFERWMMHAAIILVIVIVGVFYFHIVHLPSLSGVLPKATNGLPSGTTIQQKLPPGQRAHDACAKKVKGTKGGVIQVKVNPTTIVYQCSGTNVFVTIGKQ